MEPSIIASALHRKFRWRGPTFLSRTTIREVRFPVRLGKRTKALAPTLETGSWVVVDHPDMDSVAARSLIESRPVAVVNCSPFVTGRYPNQGPRELMDAGILLYETRVDLFGVLADGELVRRDGDRWWRQNGELVPELVPLDTTALQSRLADARHNLDTELARFARNTVEFLERPRERGLLLDLAALPSIETPMAGRHVLVAVRGPDFERDLKRLVPYFRDRRPAVIAVDGAADALIGLGIPVDVILGDMDSVSDSGLRSAKEIVVHAFPSEGGGAVTAPGAERVERLGLRYQLFPIPGTSEDAAMVLAYEKGADLIVAVGSHSNLEDFLDKGRGGMASTFLVRLKVGSRLVDARGVSRLHGDTSRASGWLAGLILSAAFPVLVLIAGTPFGVMISRVAKVWWRTLLP